MEREGKGVISLEIGAIYSDKKGGDFTQTVRLRRTSWRVTGLQMIEAIASGDNLSKGGDFTRRAERMWVSKGVISLMSLCF